MTESGELFAAIERAERELLDSGVRGDATVLDGLLHPDFVEIGRSGTFWSRAEIVAALGEEDERESPVADEWRFDELAPGLVLATYRLRDDDAVSRHASIWDVSSGSPRLRFHQGTRLPPGVEEPRSEL